jgi:beta-lactamase class D
VPAISGRFIASLFILFSFHATAEDQDIAKLFARHGVEGTIVISSLRSGQTFIHNDLRANHRFSPASTFKIPNTLIALEEKAISGKDDMFKWDGHVYANAEWNHDQTLGYAFKISCVWCYQELARKVGAEKYRRYVRKLAYGALHEPFDGTNFWLDGSLEISALEQVDFLKKVYQRTLPFSSSSFETLAQIMLVEKTPTFALFGKTGYGGKLKPIGWYVGYVETAKDIWFFATNVEVRDDRDLPVRLTLTREALRAKGIIQ